MRFAATFALLSLGLAALPALAAPAEPVSLPRQGGWEINYDTDACHIFGRFGTGKDEVIIGFTRYAPSDYIDMGLIGKPVQSRDPQTAIELAFGDAPPVRTWGMAGKAGASKLPMLTLTGLRLDGLHVASNDILPPQITPAQEAAVRSITFRLRGGKPYRLETGSMAKPMEGMRTCLSDLMRSWGFDPAVQLSLSRPVLPASNPDMWFRDTDYPKHSAMQGHNGLVQVRLDIDAQGKITKCHVLRRTNPDEFADITCQVLNKRAKFAPALDASGKPVASFYMYKLQFTSLNNL